MHIGTKYIGNFIQYYTGKETNTSLLFCPNKYKKVLNKKQLGKSELCPKNNI